MDVDGVILAAGYSSRIDTFKMEIEIDKKAILQRCIEALYDACSHIIVVSGYNHERVTKLVGSYAKVKVIYNEEFHKGMFSSIKKGIKDVTASKFLLTPGDYPLINKETVNKLISVNKEIVIPSFNRKGGHPVLLSRNIIKEILQEPDNSNLKIYLNRKQCSYLNVSDEGIVLDVDTISDYEYAKKIARI